MTDELYIGLMSGTSLDAIDAVAVAINADGIRLIDAIAVEIPDHLRQQILSVSTSPTTIEEIGLVDHRLGKLYASVVNQLLFKSNLTAPGITAIGNHGQTVFHQPDGEYRFTMQLGDANLIATLTGIDTVADFRRMDMALGGQGAPLAPAFHQYLFQGSNACTVVLNIGGIANITVIHKDGSVTGFDTGPGNTLLDAWYQQHTRKSYDSNAAWALKGKVNTALLQQLMNDDYLTLPPPKSTGREHFNLDWLDKKFNEALPPEDIQHTLCEFTALSAAQQIDPFCYGTNAELLVCGGGAHNPLIMQRLRHHLPAWQVKPSSSRGVPEDYMEAMAFAWLAYQHVHKQPATLPSVTGASRATVPGVLYAAGSEPV